MKPDKNSDRMTDGCLLYFAGELLLWCLIPFVCVGAFVIFDFLHISDPNWQVAVFVLPPVILCYVVWRRDKARAQATLEASPPTAEDDVTSPNTRPTP